MTKDSLLRLDFTRRDLPLVRLMMTECLSRAGVREPVRGTFVQSALEIAGNAVVLGGGSGQLVLRAIDGELRCEVTDRGASRHGAAPSQAPPWQPNYGLQLVEALTARPELHPGPQGRGTIATVAVRP